MVSPVPALARTSPLKEIEEGVSERGWCLWAPGVGNGRVRQDGRGINSCSTIQVAAVALWRVICYLCSLTYKVEVRGLWGPRGLCSWFCKQPVARKWELFHGYTPPEAELPINNGKLSHPSWVQQQAFWEGGLALHTYQGQGQRLGLSRAQQGLGLWSRGCGRSLAHHWVSVSEGKKWWGNHTPTGEEPHA